MRCVVRLSLCLLLSIAAASNAQAQSAEVSGLLLSMAQRSDTIVVAEVKRIVPSGGSVVITLHIESALKGSPPTDYTLREWAGLWSAAQRRYWIGERALFFLHAPSGASGFASPVAGMDGVVPVLAAADSARVVLTRLRTQVVRERGATVPAVGAETSVRDVAALLATPAIANPIRTPIHLQQALPVVVQPVRGAPTVVQEAPLANN